MDPHEGKASKRADRCSGLLQKALCEFYNQSIYERLK